MSLIIREKVLNECTTLARKVESVVRSDPSVELADDKVEELCGDHVKTILANAHRLIEKEVEEHDNRLKDSDCLRRTTEMYGTKRCDIQEVVNIHIRTSEDDDDPDFHQTTHTFTDFYSHSDLDPDEKIKMTYISPAAEINDVNEQDLLEHGPESDYWEDYQTRYDFVVEKPYQEFFGCGSKIVSLLQKHCNSAEDVLEKLKILASRPDYTRLIEINVMVRLAELLLQLKKSGNEESDDDNSNDNDSSSNSNQPTSDNKKRKLKV
jgi:hypothetical protein